MVYCNDIHPDRLILSSDVQSSSSPAVVKEVIDDSGQVIYQVQKGQQIKIYCPTNFNELISEFSIIRLKVIQSEDDDRPAVMTAKADDCHDTLDPSDEGPGIK